MSRTGPALMAWALVALGGVSTLLATFAVRASKERTRAEEVARAERLQNEARRTELDAARDLEVARARELATQERLQRALAEARELAAGRATASRDPWGDRREIEELARDHPREPAFLSILARFDRRAGRGDLALASLARILELAPADRQARMAAFEVAWEIGEREIARSHASASGTGPAEAALAIGLDALVRAGPPDRGIDPEFSSLALTAFARASQARPEDPWPRRFAARTLLSAGRIGDALVQLDLAEPLADPEESIPYARGCALGAKGDDVGALVEYTTALARWATYRDALEARSRVLVRLGRPGEARRDLELALLLDPARPGAHEALGEALLDLGVAQAAELSFLRALELDGGSTRARARLGLGRILLGRGESGPALEELERAIEIDPSLVDSRRLAAAALVALGRFEEALDQLDRAVDLAPDDPELLVARGEAALAAGSRHQVAVDDLERALALGASGWRLDETLGDALAALGRTTEAALYWKRAAATNPSEGPRLLTKIDGLRDR